jgi:armadillo repeat-containing protein 8
VDANNGVQEQALSVLKNLADDEPGINMVFQGMDPAILLDLLGRALSSSDDDVVLQVSETDPETYIGIKP